MLAPSECDPAPESVWNRVEYQSLTKNVAVTKIVRVDPAKMTLTTMI